MGTDRISRILAARKGVKTRAANKAQLDYILKIVEPRKRRQQALYTLLLRAYPNGLIKLKWDEARAGHKLKKGAEYGTLVGFRHGHYWLVRPDGYKRPQLFDPAFWEVLVP